MDFGTDERLKAERPEGSPDASGLSLETMRRLFGVVRDLTRARTLDAVIETVRVAALDLTGADGVSFVLREGDLVHYVDEEAVEPLWKGRRFRADACISGWVMEHRTPAVIPDVYADPRVPHDVYRPTFVRSLVMVPIRREDPLGSIGAYWRAPTQPSPEAVHALEALSDVCASAVANVRMYDELQRTVLSRDELLGIAAHELREPLSPLKLQAELLLRAVEEGRAEPSATRAGLARIARQVERLSRLVESMLEMARNGRGRLSLDPEELDLTHATTEVVTRFRRDIEASGSAVTVHSPGAVRGRWDAIKIDQIVTNLLSNAIKYGAGRPVDVVIEDLGEVARLSVRDRGIGVTPDLQHQIFERFARAVPEDASPGLGIGLWLVREFVEAHGGSIRVDSTPGQGSTFTVTLPRNRH